MVPSDHINNMGWLWETIITLYGMGTLYVPYAMVHRNHTKPVWYPVTISTIKDGLGKLY